MLRPETWCFHEENTYETIEYKRSTIDNVNLSPQCVRTHNFAMFNDVDNHGSTRDHPVPKTSIKHALNSYELMTMKQLQNHRNSNKFNRRCTVKDAVAA